MKLYRTENWYCELGDVIFFHFENDLEMVEVTFSSPGNCQWDCMGEGYWTHYYLIDKEALMDSIINAE